MGPRIKCLEWSQRGQRGQSTLWGRCKLGKTRRNLNPIWTLSFMRVVEQGRLRHALLRHQAWLSCISIFSHTQTRVSWKYLIVTQIGNQRIMSHNDFNFFLFLSSLFTCRKWRHFPVVNQLKVYSKDRSGISWLTLSFFPSSLIQIHPDRFSCCLPGKILAWNSEAGTDLLFPHPTVLPNQTLPRIIFFILYSPPSTAIFWDLDQYDSPPWLFLGLTLGGWVILLEIVTQWFVTQWYGSLRMTSERLLRCLSHTAKAENTRRLLQKFCT